jgi:hypothetical protein
LYLGLEKKILRPPKFGGPVIWACLHWFWAGPELNHEVLITRHNIIDFTNKRIKFGTTTTKMMNCIHYTFGIRLKDNMSIASLFHVL